MVLVDYIGICYISECFLYLNKSYLSFNKKKRFFRNQINQKQELPVVAMFVNGSGQNEQTL